MSVRWSALGQRLLGYTFTFVQVYFHDAAGGSQRSRVPRLTNRWFLGTTDTYRRDPDVTQKCRRMWKFKADLKCVVHEYTIKLINTAQALSTSSWTQSALFLHGNEAPFSSSILHEIKKKFFFSLSPFEEFGRCSWNLKLTRKFPKGKTITFGNHRMTSQWKPSMSCSPYRVLSILSLAL